MIERIDVFAGKNKVGTLALTKDNRVAFQYSEGWIENGFSINPFKLPLSNRVFVSTSPCFKGLFGVLFANGASSHSENSYLWFARGAGFPHSK